MFLLLLLILFSIRLWVIKEGPEVTDCLSEGGELRTSNVTHFLWLQTFHLLQHNFLPVVGSAHHYVLCARTDLAGNVLSTLNLRGEKFLESGCRRTMKDRFSAASEEKCPLISGVKSPKALAMCGILENPVITKADGFVREHLRTRDKEMEQKETPEPSPHIPSCPSSMQITVGSSHTGGKAREKIVEGCVTHCPVLPWQGCNVPPLTKTLSPILNHLICSPLVIPGYSSLITPNYCSYNLAANTASQLPTILPGKERQSKMLDGTQARPVFPENSFLKILSCPSGWALFLAEQESILKKDHCSPDCRQPPQLRVLGLGQRFGTADG